MPQPDGRGASAGVGQATALAARIIAIAIRFDQPRPLQVFEHGLDKLRGSAELGCQCTGLERTPITDLFNQSFKHIYIPKASAR